MAEGEFICFLDSDDLAQPFGLAELLEDLRTHGHAPFAVGNVRDCDLAGNPIYWKHSVRARFSSANLFKNRWMTGAALYRRSTLRRSGKFVDSLRTGEDLELCWRVVAMNGTGLLIDKIVGLRRHHGLGHLSLNRDGESYVRSAINARAAFADWIESQGLPRQKMNFSRLVSLVGLGVRAGRSGNDAARLIAFSLPQRLWNLTPLANILLRMLGSPQSRVYYSCTFLVFRALRRSRAALLSVCERLRQTVTVNRQ